MNPQYIECIALNISESLYVNMLLNCGSGEDSWESWTARRANQSILKEINPEYSLKELILKPPSPPAFSLFLMLGKTEGRRRGWQNEMVGWHHRFNGHEFAQILGDGEGQGNLACYSPWGHKESDMTKGLNNSNKCIVNAMFCVNWVIFFSQHLYLQAADSLSKIRVYYKATLSNVMAKEGRDK